MSMIQRPKTYRAKNNTQKGHQTAFNNGQIPIPSDELYMSPKLGNMCKNTNTI